MTSSSSELTLVLFLVTAFNCFESSVAIRCAMCDTSSPSTRLACLTGPPPPKECPEGLNFCINVAKYNTEGVLQYFTRTCNAFHSVDASCVPSTDKNTNEPIQICYETCATDECNANRAIHHVMDFLRK